MKPCKVEIASARLAKALAQAAGAVKYEGQTCVRCESNIRYSQTGNCVECTFHREGVRRELKARRPKLASLEVKP